MTALGPDCALTRGASQPSPSFSTQPLTVAVAKSFEGSRPDSRHAACMSAIPATPCATFAVPLIQGNILRGRVYPLSVAAERVLQAELVARLALELKADGVAHGSTGAGNDQVRFDAVFRVLAPNLTVHAPIRELGWSRRQETDYLAKRGVKVAAKKTAYSVNAGLWGTTVGGGETHDAWAEVPDSAFPAPVKAAKGVKEVVIGFKKGVPAALDGKKLEGVALVQALHALGTACGVGRGVHLGDTILGIKGRIGFEAPAPLMLIAAHTELEKLV